MQQTQNYNLNKPDRTDYAKIEALNANADIIDAKLKELEDNSDLTEIQQSVSNLDTKVTQHLDESKTEAHKASNISFAPIAGMTATDVQGAIAEVKQQANDIKTKWASVVGSPLVSTDTQAQLQSKTQTIKNTLASNLNNKEIIANGTETLTDLVNKVGNIIIKKKLSSELDTHMAVPYSVDDTYIWLQDSVSVEGGSTWQWSKFRRENDILIKRYVGAISVCCYGEIKMSNNNVQIFDESTGVLLKSFPRGGIDLSNDIPLFITEDKKYFLTMHRSSGRDIKKYDDTGLLDRQVQTRNSSPSLATSDKNIIINRSGNEFFKVADLSSQPININKDLATVLIVHNDYE